MVRFSEAFSMALASVVDYGNNVTTSSEDREGEPYVGTQERPRRTGDRRRRGHPRLGLLPRPPLPGRARLLGRLDRQSDRAGAVPPDLHRRGAHRAVLRLAQHLPPGPCLIIIRGKFQQTSLTSRKSHLSP